MIDSLLDSTGDLKKMPITVTCRCGKQSNVADELAGTGIECSGCRAVMQVPVTSSAPPPKGGSKTKLWVELAVGGLLLLSVCIAGYFLFLAGPGDPEKEIVGKWEFDGRSETEIGWYLEFKADGAFTRTDHKDDVLKLSYADGKWKRISKQGNIMTVELSYFPVSSLGVKSPETKRMMDCTIVSQNEMKLRYLHYGDKRFKRIR
jgi:hypothetical protein